MKKAKTETVNNSKLIKVYTDTGWELKNEGKNTLTFFKPKKTYLTEMWISLLISFVIFPVAIITIYYIFKRLNSKDETLSVPL